MKNKMLFLGYTDKILGKFVKKKKGKKSETLFVIKLKTITFVLLLEAEKNISGSDVTGLFRRNTYVIKMATPSCRSCVVIHGQ